MNRRDTVAVLVFGIVLSVMAGRMLFFGGWGSAVPQERTEHPATTVLRTVGSGQPVGLLKFNSAFPSSVNMMDSGGYEVAADLGFPNSKEGCETFREMLDRRNYAVIYIGPPEGIPAQLRPTTQPSTAPATQPVIHRGHGYADDE